MTSAARQQRNEEDEDLIVRVAEGDKMAFRLLAARYTGLLFSVAYRMHPSHTDAEDIVQESLLRIWNKAAQWDSSRGGSVSTWIYSVAFNISVDFKRRAHVHKDIDSAVDIADNSTLSPESVAGQGKLADAVKSALQDLPERQRAVLVLCHYEGLSNAEAASVMGTSVKGIEGLLMRARSTLQKKLQSTKEYLSL